MIFTRAARLARPRFGWLWAMPVLVMVALLTFTHGFLTRMELSPEADRAYNFGGRDTAIYFNGFLPTTGTDFPLDARIEDVETVTGSDACAEINSFLGTPARDQTFYSYREFVSPCGPETVGYALTDGTWATRPGDVVATTATGLAVGDRLDGSTPVTLTVVGIASNPHATRASALLAASGTWRSWDWPSAATAFPRLTATVIAYVDATSVTALGDHFGAITAADPSAATVDVASSAHTGDSIIDRMPFLYLWSALPIAIISAALTLVLRARWQADRVSTLTAQGMPRGSATQATALATLYVVIVAAVVGVVGGLLLTWLSGPIVGWAAGHTPASAPLPWDPAVRAATAILIVVVIGYVIARLRTPPRTESVEAARELSAVTVRRVLAILSVGIAILISFVVPDIISTFAMLAFGVVAFGFIAPELMRAIARLLDRGSVTNRLAWRRLAHRPMTAALAATAAAVTVGPVLTIGVLLASGVEAQNVSARTPPRDGQAIYYVSGDASVDDRVVGIALEAAGPDGTTTSVSQPQTAEGGGLVATDRGFGAVDAVVSVEDLERLLGSEVSDEAAAALDAGGILWSPGYQGTTLWTVGPGEQQSFPLPAAHTESFEERWARSTAGFILTSTAESLGLTTADTLIAINGIAEDETQKVATLLIDRGYDAGLVRTYRSEDPYRVEPFQYGIAAVLGLAGAAVLAASVRGSVDALRKQSSALFALGVSRSWLARVFLREVGGALAVGVSASIAISALTIVTGAGRLGYVVVVPWVPVGAYLLGLTAFLAALSLLAFRRIRA